MQAWYYEAVARTPETPPLLKRDKLVAPVYQAALTEIREARLAPLPLAALQGIKITAALKLVPEYVSMRQYIPYDGVL